MLFSEMMVSGGRLLQGEGMSSQVAYELLCDQSAPGLPLGRYVVILDRKLSTDSAAMRLVLAASFAAEFPILGLHRTEAGGIVVEVDKVTFREVFESPVEEGEIQIGLLRFGTRPGTPLCALSKWERDGILIYVAMRSIEPGYPLSWVPEDARRNPTEGEVKLAELVLSKEVS